MSFAPPPPPAGAAAAAAPHAFLAGRTEVRWGILGCGDVVLKKSGPSIRAASRRACFSL